MNRHTDSSSQFNPYPSPSFLHSIIPSSSYVPHPVELGYSREAEKVHEASSHAKTEKQASTVIIQIALDEEKCGVK